MVNLNDVKNNDLKVEIKDCSTNNVCGIPKMLLKSNQKMLVSSDI